MALYFKDKPTNNDFLQMRLDISKHVHIICFIFETINPLLTSMSVLNNEVSMSNQVPG